jgi:hypothetical protein
MWEDKDQDNDRDNDGQDKESGAGLRAGSPERGTYPPYNRSISSRVIRTHSRTRSGSF